MADEDVALGTAPDRGRITAAPGFVLVVNGVVKGPEATIEAGDTLAIRRATGEPRWCACGQPWMPAAGLYGTTEEVECPACVLRRMLSALDGELEKLRALHTAVVEWAADAELLDPESSAMQTATGTERRVLLALDEMRAFVEGRLEQLGGGAPAEARTDLASVASGVIVALGQARKQNDREWDELVRLVVKAVADPSPGNVKAMLDTEYELTGDCDTTSAIADAAGFKEDEP